MAQYLFILNSAFSCVIKTYIGIKTDIDILLIFTFIIIIIVTIVGKVFKSFNRFVMYFDVSPIASLCIVSKRLHLAYVEMLVLPMLLVGRSIVDNDRRRAGRHCHSAGVGVRQEGPRGKVSFLGSTSPVIDCGA